ncbi:MAG TPA: amidohydrolase/deacetylase family metallohydrolase [Terriglobia bacterium]|nr:amidohydrolase/deacetylase family metallohydrolase [Terriglobia bacterium]
MINRRQFLVSSAILAGVPIPAAPKYDVLIQGGRVLDPSQRLDRIMDIAVRDGKIAALETNIAASDAMDVFDAKGRIVTPGLVDIHAHPRPGEVSPQQILSNGVTTVVDGGSRGADGIQDMVGVARNAPNRVRILINVSRLGNQPGGELLNFDTANAEAARAAIRIHRDLIVGVKARLSRPLAGDRDLETVRRAHEVTRPFGIPVMVHIGDTRSPLPDILALLREGDIVTHVYAPPPNGILDNNGRVLQQVRDARRRGILFDIGNGRNGHITWEVADRALQQDFLPDTISSDLNGAGLTDQVFDFPNVLSKFLMLGMTLDQVIARGTVNAAKAIPALKDFGTLRKGAVADISVLELAQGNFEFVDNVNTKRTGRQKLFARAVFVAGRRWTQ